MSPRAETSSLPSVALPAAPRAAERADPAAPDVSLSVSQQLRRTGHWPTLATSFLYFDVSFMVWTMLGALGALIAPALGLTSEQKFLMVSTPILAGAVLRIALSLLVDRIGTKNTGLLAQITVMCGLLMAWQFGQIGRAHV
jgi:NNP family nitrate/nitrite transporter-like MFS transporter